MATLIPELRILIVDDSPEDREMLSFMALETGRLKPQAVATGAEALALLAEESVDCVLVDYRLEDGNSASLIVRIASLENGPAVISVSGSGSEEVALDVMRAGSARYLVKRGLTPEMLLSAVEGTMRLHRRTRDTDAS